MSLYIHPIPLDVLSDNVGPRLALPTKRMEKHSCMLTPEEFSYQQLSGIFTDIPSPPKLLDGNLNALSVRNTRKSISLMKSNNQIKNYNQKLKYCFKCFRAMTLILTCCQKAVDLITKLLYLNDGKPVNTLCFVYV